MVFLSDVVNDIASVSSLVDLILRLPSRPPPIYFSFERGRISHKGSIAVLALLVHPQDRVHLVDVGVLDSEAFTAVGTSGKTMKDILESRTIPKFRFDIKRNSKMLYTGFGVALDGVSDIQLMESPVRGPRSSRQPPLCLEECIAKAPIDSFEKHAWALANERGGKRRSSERGNCDRIWGNRSDLRKYLVEKVCIMPLLREEYWYSLDKIEKANVKKTTSKRTHPKSFRRASVAFIERSRAVCNKSLDCIDWRKAQRCFKLKLRGWSRSSSALTVSSNSSEAHLHATSSTKLKDDP